MVARLIWTLIVLALAQPVFGQASGLNTIPTADVLEPGRVDIEVGRNGRTSHPLGQTGSGIGIEFGAGHGVELGYERVNEDAVRGLWNAKVAVAYRDQDPVLAVGVQDVGRHSEAEPYTVGFVPFHNGRIHAGAIRVTSAVRPMFGYDAPWGDKLTLQADYTAGSENAGSIGVVYNSNNPLALTVAYIRNNSGPDRSHYSLLIEWQFGGRKD